MRYFWHFTLLALGLAATTAGLMWWHTHSFNLTGLWSLQLHPVHLQVLGLAIIPPSLWEIFVLESHRHRG